MLPLFFRYFNCWYLKLRFFLDDFLDENYLQTPIVRQYSDRRSDPKKVGECCVAQESSQKAPFLPSTPIKGDSTWRNNTTDYQPSTPQTLKPRLLLLILQGKR